MSFLESPRFPERISFDAVGGPGYSTTVITVRSGREYRDAAWAQARGRWDVAHAAKLQDDADALIAFFRRCQGRLIGFRFKDWADYEATAQGLQALQGTELVGAYGFGYGVPTYQLLKRYGSGSVLEDRRITKPVAGSVSLTRDGSPVTLGVAAGNAAIDTTAGTVTFVADQTKLLASHTPGAQHQIDVGVAFSPNFVIGERVYLSGLTGTAASVLNGLSHAVVNVAGSVLTLGTNTAGLTVTNSGVVARYPQATEALAWSGEFDVPCRFDTDEMRLQHIDKSGGTFVYTWAGIPIIEIRHP